MPTSFPQLVISRDGRRAILVEILERDEFARSRFDGFHLDCRVRLSPNGDLSPIDLKVSGSFRSMWNGKGQTMRWDQEFDLALPDLALIALGKYLDDNSVPADPPDGEYAATVNVFSDLFDIFTQTRADDSELETYVHGKIYWAWKFGHEPTLFASWESHRLRVSLPQLERAAFPNVGVLWEHGKNGYKALPALARRPASTGPNPTSTRPLEPTYDVALSFAGEQRPFVHEVARTLRDAGARVFYDDFIDLWGRDLTTELERIYRDGSRFVVVFVSHEYLQKAWPNLERQHALAGRIERMDDSVLPARFDPVSLPGLPTTVSYLDIGQRTPQELGGLILDKLRT